jgi:hypothetical protein
MVERSIEGELRVERPRCPYCHGDVLAEEEKQGCTACMAWHHRECWRDAGERCATCGRSEAGPALVVPTAPGVQAVSHDTHVEPVPIPAAESHAQAPATSAGLERSVSVLGGGCLGAVTGLGLAGIVWGVFLAWGMPLESGLFLPAIGAVVGAALGWWSARSAHG